MSNFSAALTELMERKNISSNDVIQQTGINRSTFFKIKKGTRNPADPQTVSRICNVLRLNKEDREQLQEAYEIDRVGAYRYYGMKSIQKFFMSKIKNSEAPGTTAALSEFGEGEQIRVYRDVIEVRAVILGILCDKSSKISILEANMNPIYVTAVPMASKASPGTTFQHIFMLDDSDEVGINHQLYNVNCFRNITDIMVRTIRYEARYYYSPVSGIGRSDRQLNFIVSDRYLLTYSDTLDSAVLYNNTDILELYREIFDRYLKDSVCFAKIMSLEGMFFNWEEMVDSKENGFDDAYCFIPGICTTICLDENDPLTDRYIDDALENKKEFIACFENYRKNMIKLYNEMGDRLHFLSAVNAVENFVRTGYINEFPKKLAVPFEPDERPILLRKWRNRAGLFNVKGIREKSIPPTSSLSVAATRQEITFTVIYEQEAKLVSIIVEEAGIVGLIYEYLENLEKNAMDRDEYKDYLDELSSKMTESFN